MGPTTFQILNITSSVPLVCKYSFYLCSLPYQRHEIKRLLELSYNQPQDRIKILQDFHQLYQQGNTLLLLNFLRFHIYTELLTGNDEQLIDIFISEGLLDYLSHIICTETDIRVLVLSLLFVALFKLLRNSHV